jgi:hypothetical protein
LRVLAFMITSFFDRDKGGTKNVRSKVKKQAGENPPVLLSTTVAAYNPPLFPVLLPIEPLPLFMGTLPPTEPPELGRTDAPLPVPLGFGVPAAGLPIEPGLSEVEAVLGDGLGLSVELSPEDMPPIGDTLGVPLLLKAVGAIGWAPPLMPVEPYFLFSTASCLIFASQSALP